MTPLTLLHKEEERMDRNMRSERVFRTDRENYELRRNAARRMLRLLIGPPLRGWQP